MKMEILSSLEIVVRLRLKPMINGLMVLMFASLEALTRAAILTKEQSPV